MGLRGPRSAAQMATRPLGHTSRTGQPIDIAGLRAQHEIRKSRDLERLLTRLERNHEAYYDGTKWCWMR